MEIEEIFIHSDWNPQDPTFDADIAVLLFKEEAVFSQYVKAICLPSTTPTNELEGGTIVGWGQKVFERQTENLPLKSQMNESPCTEVARTLSSSRNFCATSRSSSACQGDSGNFTLIILIPRLN